MSQDKQVVPFFARYLESQAEDMSAEELNEVSGGGDIVTQAYPSDGDTADGGYPSSKPQNPFDYGINFPKGFPDFPFANGSHYVK
jgi:Serine endopeptidase inhibitors